MYAARQGNIEAAATLLESGAKINLVNADGSTALLLALMNGKFDLAKFLIERGADVQITSVDGASPLYALLNMQWARKTFHPQPTLKTQKTYYLDLARLMLDRGADPNTRLKKNLYSIEFNFTLDSSNATGTTAFWRCAAAADLDCMRLLVSRGADPKIASTDNITPLMIAAGVAFHGNDEVTSSYGRLAAVKYLIEELGLDVNAIAGREPQPGEGAGQPAQQNRRNIDGFTALHGAAGRRDNEMVIYLVSRGANVNAVTNNGITVVDAANGSRDRVQPYRETIALLEALGAKNSFKCISC